MGRTIHFARHPRVHRLFGGFMLLLAVLSALTVDKPVPIAVVCLRGFWMIFGFLSLTSRRGVTLDFDRREVRIIFGFVVPWRTERRPFDSFTHVTLTSGPRPGALHRAHLFHVGLMDQEAHLLLGASPDYRQARRWARDIAQRMKLGLFDHGQVREPGHVGEPLRDRLLRTGAVPGHDAIDAQDPYRAAVKVRKPPEAPAGGTVRVHTGEGRTTIELRGRAPLRPRAAVLIFGGALLFGLAARLDAQVIVVPPALYGIAAVLLAAGGLPWLRALTTRWRITVDKQAIEVARRTPLWPRHVSIPLAALEDLRVASAEEAPYQALISRLEHGPRTRFAVAVADDRAIAFAAGASDEALDFVVARLAHAVATT